VPNAVRFAGYRPSYIDIRLSDFNMDPDALESRITADTGVVVMQHTFGIPADVAKIRSICERHKLFLIEDGAHALGGMYGGRPIGWWGDAAFFSTETSKMISTDQGGLLVTSNSELAAKIRSLCSSLPLRSTELEKMACKRIIYNVLTKDIWLSLVARMLSRLCGRRLADLPRFKSYFSSFENEYQAELAGVQFACYPRRLAGILCRSGELQVHRLAEDVKRRNEKVAFLARILPRYGARVPTYDHEQCYPSFVKYPFLVEDRQRWTQALEKLGLPSWTWPE
jgi:dTDP-4-amino-4,6-dideoxygalactose transaminase